MNNQLSKPAPSTLLMKLKEMSRPVVSLQEEAVTSEFADEIRATYPPTTVEHRFLNPNMPTQMEPATEYDNIFSVTEAQMFASSDISLGAMSQLDNISNPTFNDMRAAYTGRGLVHWMRIHLSCLNAAVSSSNKMDEAAIDQCARDIITNASWLTLCEFAVFCIRMRSPEYSKHLDTYSFGANNILRGLAQFRKERDEAEIQYEKEHPYQGYDPEAWKLQAKDMPDGVYWVNSIAVTVKDGQIVNERIGHTQAELDAIANEELKKAVLDSPDPILARTQFLNKSLQARTKPKVQSHTKAEIEAFKRAHLGDNYVLPDIPTLKEEDYAPPVK